MTSLPCPHLPPGAAFAELLPQVHSTDVQSLGYYFFPLLAHMQPTYISISSVYCIMESQSSRSVVHRALSPGWATSRQAPDLAVATNGSNQVLRHVIQPFSPGLAEAVHSQRHHGIYCLQLLCDAYVYHSFDVMRMSYRLSKAETR